MPWLDIPPNFVDLREEHETNINIHPLQLQPSPLPHPLPGI